KYKAEPSPELPVSIGVSQRTVPVTRPASCVASPGTPGVQLYGPSDVTSIDPRMIVRSVPPANAVNVPPARNAEIDFSDPNLPWQYSPSSCRTIAWMTLLVLKTPDFTFGAPSPSAPYPTILIANAAALPSVQFASVAGERVSGQALAGPPSAQTLHQAQTSPSSVTSYVASTSGLEQSTQYHAFLVPTFLAGVQAGTAQAVPGTGGSTFAWSASQSSIVLPVYYEFTFRTGIGAS
ncbi:MAG: hypothetical protein ACYDGM_14135, partial [Vulcanimicrobiaceae bacterium]